MAVGMKRWLLGHLFSLYYTKSLEINFVDKKCIGHVPVVSNVTNNHVTEGKMLMKGAAIRISHRCPPLTPVLLISVWRIKKTLSLPEH